MIKKVNFKSFVVLSLSTFIHRSRLLLECEKSRSTYIFTFLFNIKNLSFKFPERYYQTDAGVTSLAFSHTRSNLLAVKDNNDKKSVCLFKKNISLSLGWFIQW